jgi:hypothetical protein
LWKITVLCISIDEEIEEDCRSIEMRLSEVKRIREGWISILLILVVSLLTYAPLINQLGFYRDDWYLLWTNVTEGKQGLLNLFIGDRPFLGWLYVVDFPIFGINPLAWHLYALVVKIFSIFALFWFFRELWPNRKVETTFITLFFAVYPGFYQQPDALTFKQLLLGYGAAMLSLGLTIRVAKTTSNLQKTLLTLLSLLFAGVYIFIYEPLIGLEAARLALIWYYVYRQNPKWRESIRPTLMKFVPYLIFTLTFLVWRIFLFHSTRKAVSAEILTENYKSLHGMIRFFVETLKDLFETTVLAWGVPYYQFTVNAKYRDMGLAFGFALLALLLSLGYYFFMQKQTEAEDDTDHESRADWLVLGAVIIFVTTLPFIAAGRNAIFAIQWDRYTYQSAMGVAMLVGGFVFYALRGRLRMVVLSLLLVTGIVTQIFSAMYYRDLWNAERAVWWQLYWRAPQLTDGTNIIASLPGGYQLAEEYEIWAPLGLLYRHGEPLTISAQVPYPDILVNLSRGLQEQRLVRDTVIVNRNYEQSMVVSLPNEQSCLHVYNGALGLSLNENPMVTLIAPYSSTEWIQVNATPVPSPDQFLGNEPAHDWCFYYQKISLALQAGDWTKAANLSDEVIASDFRPQESSEWLPVLFAYANSDQPQKLRHASTYINDKYTRWYLCDQLKSADKLPAGYQADLVLENLCGPK